MGTFTFDDKTLETLGSDGRATLKNALIAAQDFQAASLVRDYKPLVKRTVTPTKDLYARYVFTLTWKNGGYYVSRPELSAESPLDIMRVSDARAVGASIVTKIVEQETAALQTELKVADEGLKQAYEKIKILEKKHVQDCKQTFSSSADRWNRGVLSWAKTLSRAQYAELPSFNSIAAYFRTIGNEQEAKAIAKGYEDRAPFNKFMQIEDSEGFGLHTDRAIELIKKLKADKEKLEESIKELTTYEFVDGVPTTEDLVKVVLNVCALVRADQIGLKSWAVEFKKSIDNLQAFNLSGYHLEMNKRDAELKTWRATTKSNPDLPMFCNLSSVVDESPGLKIIRDVFAPRMLFPGMTITKDDILALAKDINVALRKEEI